jgi:hypothetical protein
MVGGRDIRNGLLWISYGSRDCLGLLFERLSGLWVDLGGLGLLLLLLLLKCIY